MPRFLSSLPLAAAAIGLAAYNASADVINPDNGHTYFLTPTAMTWQDAQSWAVSVGGNLATIRSTSENEFLKTAFPKTDNWIGFTDTEVEGVWKWVSGEPVTFTAWLPGEPNNYASDPAGEDYAASLYGQWSDWSSPLYFGMPNPKYGVVELVPAPHVYALPMIAALCPIYRRRR